jgi:phosphonatase-like hydrolase
MKPPIELVIFDMTATTVRDNNVVSRCLQEALATAGVTRSPMEINAVMGMAKITAVRMLLTANQGRRPDDDEVRAVHDAFVERMMSFYRSDGAVQEMPGATRVIRELRAAGYKVALDTGFTRPVVNVILERLGWSEAGFLDATVASNEVENGRPHPDLVLEAMRRTRVRHVEATAKVGDTPADLQEGMSAGCGLVIGVTHGTHSREELACYPHTHLIDHLDELPPLLGLARKEGAAVAGSWRIG